MSSERQPTLTADERNRIDAAVKLASLPGIKVKNVRELVGLGSTGDEEVDNMLLNLPEGRIG